MLQRTSALRRVFGPDLLAQTFSNAASQCAGRCAAHFVKPFCAAYFTMSDFPVICWGLGISMSSSIVGATSANVPSFRSSGR